MVLFAIATLSPFALIFLASFLGGAWGWMAVGYITVLVFALDRLISSEAVNPDPEAEFPTQTLLLNTLGILHFTLLVSAIWAVGGNSGLSGIERALVALSAALVFGQLSHPVAHELIHRPARVQRLLGRLIYTTLLFGHHASAHLRVHHVHVASKEDPNSARRGQGFYRFALKAWPGAFRAGLRAENRLRRHRRADLFSHPYTLYVGGAVATGTAALGLAGSGGFFALVFMAIYAQVQILLSDYIQHYGLRRGILADGTVEPVGPQHSWNAPHVYSSAMTLNAPRHSDHHVAPSRPYPSLQLDAPTMPYLPHSLPVMAVLALVPPLWRKIMDPLCHAWQPHWEARAARPDSGVSPAILARAKAGGLPGHVLPNSQHEKDRDTHVPNGGDTPGNGTKPDGRRRI